MDISETDAILARLDQQSSKTMVLVYVYLVAVMTSGLLGNLLVVVIYVTKYKATTTRSFIVTLAVLDLVNCILGIPGELLDLARNYTYPSAALCKGAATASAFCSLASVFVLLAVSVDRFRKICRPWSPQLSPEGAKRASLTCATAAILITWPFTVLWGYHTEATGIANVTGTGCSVADDFRSSSYPLVLNAVLFFMFLGSFVVLVTLYSLLYRQIRRQHELHRGISRPGSPVFAALGVSSDSGTDARGETRQPRRPTLPDDAGVLSLESCAHRSATPRREDGVPRTSLKDNRCNLYSTNAKTPNEASSPRSAMKEDTPPECMPGYDTKAALTTADSTDMDDHESNPRVYAGAVHRAVCVSVSPGIDSRSESESTVNIENADNDQPDDSPQRPAAELQGNTPLPKASSRRNTVGSVCPSISSEGATLRSQRGRSSEAALRQTTFTLFLVTLAFVLSFLPFLILVTVRAVTSHFLDQLEGVPLTLYALFIRSIYFQSAVNPVIYGIRNHQFRVKCRQVFQCWKLN